MLLFKMSYPEPREQAMAMSGNLNVICYGPGGWLGRAGGPGAESLKSVGCRSLAPEPLQAGIMSLSGNSSSVWWTEPKVKGWLDLKSHLAPLSVVDPQELWSADDYDSGGFESMKTRPPPVQILELWFFPAAPVCLGDTPQLE